MMAIAKRSSTSPAAPFMWRDGQGAMHDPRAMETRHLYFTVAMIWNHAAPEGAQTHQFHRYRFGPFYTLQYMKDAVRALLPELLKRKDLAPDWKAGLDHMRRYLTPEGEFREVPLLGSRAGEERP